MESFNQNIIKHKTGLFNLAAELGNISKACKMMGFSRDTFYRYQAAKNAGGVEALFEVSRRKPNLKNRVDEATEQAVTAFAIDFPAHGQVRGSNELHKQGIFVSPSGVRSIWLRHNLASIKQRLTALEKKATAKVRCSPKRKCKPWNAKNRMMKSAEKSKPTIRDILAVRTPFTLARSRGLAEFIMVIGCLVQSESQKHRYSPPPFLAADQSRAYAICFGVIAGWQLSEQHRLPLK